MSFRLVFVLLLGLTLFGKAFVSDGTAIAQTGQPTVRGELPENWQSLSAVEFNKFVGEQWENYSSETRRVLRNHAWDSFLNSPAFVAGGDKETLVAMVDRFGGSAGSRPEKAKALSRNLAARLSAEGELPDVSRLKKLRKSFKGMKPAQLDNGSLWLQHYAGNWKQLPLTDKLEMLLGFSTDLVDQKNMSVRWTGSVKATRDGQYEFLLIRNGIQDPKYKLTVGGQVAFDSSIDKASFNDQFLVSSPVALSAGGPVSIVLEMSHEVAEGSRHAWPSAGLLWRTDDKSPQFVPTSAFAPPADYQGGTGSGLQGEYFADSRFQKSVGKRIDSGLEFAWWSAPIFPKYQQPYGAVLKNCAADTFGLLEGNKLEALQKVHLEQAVAYVGSRLPLSDRAKLIKAVAESKDAMKIVKSYGVSRLVGTMCCLPGGEQVELLDQWSRARGLPRFCPGVARPGKVQTLSTGEVGDGWSLYWAIGKTLIGPHWGCSEALLNDHLELADGQCNLSLLYIATFAAYEDQWKSKGRRVAQVRQLLDDKLKDESLSGDTRVSWLIGRAFFEEAGAAHPPNWGVGNNFLMEASLVAASEDYRFWAIQELAARYAALGQVQTLENLVKATEAKLSSPEQKKLMQECCDMVKHTEEALAEQRQQQRAASVARYVNQLQRRIETARSNGRAAQAERFQKLMDKATAKQDAD